ncbi:flagellar biosynthesis protein FlhF [Tissierella praeacuta DSM 18095]|uniref:Flagellar biosynthesis protein FlhF n=1 Tax=Tissierella praeacuta DSM 18095 TaxID=1123404 RepID=A0A1M4SKL7_9FIRM|nr:DEAD/DEAH box helicase family protein [Tissierella praeacuta]SHE32729.1 flagellar biosynthesis protein FlhF [Tissierella praeacuta DSM 18095]SUP01520.1 Flagella-associated GTP-binding protein [Tissierella praeacuta]
MKIKKYIGKTAHEAMLKLKMELGSDAIVLNTKTIRHKGVFGYFKKPLVEITAAFEEKSLVDKNLTNYYESKLNDINQEIVELKKIMMNFPINKLEEEILPPILNRFHNILIENGVDSKISIELLKKIENQIDIDGKDYDTIRNIIKYNLIENLGSPKPITLENNQKTIFFVGPTGVGKTTTLAKIAANFVLKNKYDIGLITSDTYRIAAVEQLKTYSDILQLPLKIAYNKKEMIDAIDYFSSKDIILVDTAGRNHNDIEQLQELKDILYTTKSKEIYLLVNANIGCRALKTLIEKYAFLEDYRIIITKVDEAESYGNILNIKYITNKQLSYFTIGQNVPDDIETINVENIAEKLIEENKND